MSWYENSESRGFTKDPQMEFPVHSRITEKRAVNTKSSEAHNDLTTSL
jgi:hypothetical protein